MTVRAVAWWVVSSLVAGAGCGPKTPGGVEGASTTDASEGGESGVGSGESGSEGGVPTSGGPDGGSEASGASEAGESAGEPVDACEDPGDPLDTSGGYQLCRGGWVMFRAHDFTDGSQGYTAYAQFYEVLEEEKIVWDEVVHDPFTGLGDCGARTIGNSGIGPIGQTLAQDAGELRFDGPEFSTVAVKSGDPQSVINYDASMSEQGVQPGFGGLHGFVTDGATLPALDMTDAVRLPDRIELLTPGPEAEVGREEFVVTWTPSPLAFLTVL